MVCIYRNFCQFFTGLSAVLFYTTATPDCNPKVVIGVYAHAVRDRLAVASTISLKQKLSVFNFPCTIVVIVNENAVFRIRKIKLSLIPAPGHAVGNLCMSLHDPKIFSVITVKVPVGLVIFVAYKGRTKPEAAFCYIYPEIFTALWKIIWSFPQLVFILIPNFCLVAFHQ